MAQDRSHDTASCDTPPSLGITVVSAGTDVPVKTLNPNAGQQPSSSSSSSSAHWNGGERGATGSPTGEAGRNEDLVPVTIVREGDGETPLVR